jgi:hypothetical protein
MSERSVIQIQEDKAMHDEIVQRLAHHILADGPKPSEEARLHLGSCLSCLEALAVISELVERGSSDWFQSVAGQLPCGAITAEMHTFVAQDTRQLAEEKPWVVEHLHNCGSCQERFISAREMLQAQQDGLFGSPLDLTTSSSTSVWRRVAERVFEIVSDIQILVQQELIALHNLPASLADCSYVLEPAGTSRSERSETTEAKALEAGLDLIPPTIAARLKVRLLPEADGHLTIHIEAVDQITTNIPLVLYRTEPQRTLLEARSLGPSYSRARFERLPPGLYALEMRGPSGTSTVPFDIREG